MIHEEQPSGIDTMVTQEVAEAVREAVKQERERCAAILDAAARKQEQKHTEAGGWYVDDGQQFWDLADEIRKEPTA